MKRFKLFTALCFLFSMKASAQQPDLLLNEFNSKYPQEKIHIHFDKDAYVAGETMWFKAYLLSNLLPDTISSSLFVELIDRNGKVVSMKSLPVFEGTASGNIDMPDSMDRGFYTVQAYTSWMLNFDKSFLYHKNIFVFNGSSAAVVPAEKDNNNRLDFFPEGGNLISDVVNYVAYKATDKNGIPVSFSGSITDSKGNAITDLKTVHDGMGRFTLLPAADEKYFAKVKFQDGSIVTVALPAAVTGIAMHIDRSQQDIRITLSRANDIKDKKSFLILGQMENHTVFKTESVLTGESITVSVPVLNFASGILHVTLFENGKPVQERLTFINNGEYKTRGYLTSDTLNLRKREKNVFSLLIPDSIAGSYSVAVTDEDRTVNSESKDDIVSRFLLTDDLKGYVHNPFFYFNHDDKFTKDALELVMMTNGWRRFKWDELLSTHLPAIKESPQPYIRISGKVFGSNKTDLVREGDLNFFIKGKSDSTTSFFIVPIDREGNFKIDSLIFIDTATVFFNYNTKNKNKKDVWLKLDHNSGWPSPISGSYNSINDLSLPDSLLSILGKVKDQVKYYNDYTRKFLELKEIKIKAKKKTPEQLVNERYVSPFFSSYGMKTLDLINHPIPNGSRLSELIRNQIQRVQVIGSSGNISIVRGINTSLSGGRQPVTVYFDEVETDINYIDNLPVSQIALIKYAESFSMAGNNGPAIFIYSKKVEDLASTPGSFINKLTFPGYSVIKEFYSPDYSIEDTKAAASDVRTTLYWNPEILLDKQHQKETFRFYNSDECHKIKIIIEGFNGAGKLCRVEKSF